MPNPFDEPTPRGKDIYQTLSGIMHIYLGNDPEDLARGIGPDEHIRRHHVWAAAFAAGLEYMLEYPEQAAHLTTEYRRLLANEDSRQATDEVMAYVAENLYPFARPTDTANRLLDLAKQYPEKREQSTENIRPTLDNGAFSWENVPKGKLPFPTWAEEYENWEHGD